MPSARAAKVPTDTGARFERADELKERTIDALQRAFEAARRAWSPPCVDPDSISCAQRDALQLREHLTRDEIFAHCHDPRSSPN